MGVIAKQACEALSNFKGIRRRLEIRGEVNGVTVYDDFAHHPTAIRETVSALRQAIGQQRVIVVLQFGSNTMKLGEHAQQIAPSLKQADEVILLNPENFDTSKICDEIGTHAQHFDTVDQIVTQLTQIAKPQDHILIMSNKGFGGIHSKVLDMLRLRN